MSTIGTTAERKAMNKLYTADKRFSDRYPIYWATKGTERRTRMLLRNDYRYFRKAYSSARQARIQTIFNMVQDPIVSIRKAIEL